MDLPPNGHKTINLKLVNMTKRVHDDRETPRDGSDKVKPAGDGTKDNLKNDRTVDNKVIESDRAKEAEGFSVTNINVGEIQKANEKLQNSGSAFQLFDSASGETIAKSKKPAKTDGNGDGESSTSSATESSLKGRQFVKALKAPPHVLTDDEYNGLQFIARIDKYFTKRDARTVSINGRRVLIVEGTQDLGKPEQVETKTIFIDSDGTGTAVQEVYFLAKPNKYKEHLTEVNKALNAIIWN